MTCIVGVQDGSNIWMGGDRCSSDLWSWAEAQQSKVFRREVGQRPILFGICGSWVIADILRYEIRLDPPRVPVEEWLRTHLVPAFRKAADERGYTRRKDGEVTHSGAFMVALAGGLYIVQEDLSVLRSPPWGDAIGSGMEAARGSLHTTTTASNLCPVDRVEKALAAAAAVNAFVRSPFDIVSLEGS